ncbi:MAG: carbon-phosphorus lyase complex subunit PhnI, partial [Ilumatobacter sp.]
MGYAAARGGRDAIVAAERLIADRRRRSDAPAVTDDQLIERMSLLVDRVIGEGGLWEPSLAAAALRQADGDPIEAAHLVRAHRSTMPRFAYSEPVDVDDMAILRRVVPAYRQPPGPQLLGRTTDYTGRLLDLEPIDTEADAAHLDALVTDERASDGASNAPARVLRAPG